MLIPTGQTSQTWTNAPRTFLGPLVPGYLSPTGTLCLPLHLDGHVTNTGITPQNERAMKDFMSENKDRFACRNPTVALDIDEEAYLKRVRPEWLTSLWNDTNLTVRDYASVSGASQKVVDTLSSRLARFQSLVSGLLYAGSSQLPQGHFVLFSQDLTLYAQPFRRAEDNPYPLLQLLGTLFHVESLLSYGMTDTVLVEEGQDIRQTFDPSQSLPRAVSFVSEEGQRHDFDRDEIRPVCLYQGDTVGNIDINESTSPFHHHAYSGFRDYLFQETNILLGYFLFAFHKMGPTEMDVLRRQAAARRSHSGGFQGMVITAALDSLFLSQ